MAKAKSHTIEYKDSANIDTLIEIWEEGFVGDVTVCVPSERPLLIDIAPMQPNIYTPVIGSGATLNVLSVTNGQFLGMYTKDPVKRMVKIFKSGHANAWWLGYMNTEQYGEEYYRLQDYEVSFNCNNGFNALNRFKYLDGTNKYTSLETFWNILTRILAKTGLPYHYIYFASKLSCSGVTLGATETIFHKLKANQLNYYDEQENAWSYRKVLDAIIACYGLQIRQEDGSIFVYEPGMLADANWTAKRYNGTTYAYIDSVVISKNFDISSGDTDWAAEDSVLDTVSGYNKQVIRYSPYNQIGAIPEIDVSNRSIWNFEEHWAQYAYNIYRLFAYGETIDGMTFGTNTRIVGRKQTLDSPEEIYIEINPMVQNALAVTIPGYHVGRSAGKHLEITGEFYIRTRVNEYDVNEPGLLIGSVYLPVCLEIGEKRYVYSEGTWQWLSGTEILPVFYYYRGGPDEPTLADKWVQFTIEMPASINVPAGEGVLKVFHPRFFDAGFNEINSGIVAAQFRGFKCRCYDSDSRKVSDDDAKYTINLDDAFENEGSEITLYHADAINMTDRGGICKEDGVFTSLWQKPGDVSNFRLVDLLLRAIASQYQDTMAGLSGTMEADALMSANGGPNFLHTVQNTDYLGTKKLMFAGGQYDDFARTINGNWIEIKAEDLTITVE